MNANTKKTILVVLYVLNAMSMISIEIIILDLRYFLDEALTFLEFYEYGERDLTHRFQTDRQVRHLILKKIKYKP